MKRLKYVLSGLAIVGLTVVFMFFPNAYEFYSGQKSGGVSFNQINLESTEQELTSSQILHIVSEDWGNSLSSEIENNKTEADYFADCEKAINNIFGEKGNSPITQFILNLFDPYEKVSIKTYKYIILSGYDIISFNIVAAKFNDVYVCYEEKTKAVLEVVIYNSDADYNPNVPNEFSEFFSKGQVHIDYYNSFNLNNWGFNQYGNYGSNGSYEIKLAVGLFNLDEFRPGTTYNIQK